MNLRNVILFISALAVTSCKSDGQYAFGTDTTTDSTATAVEVPTAVTTVPVKPKPEVKEAETLPTSTVKELPLKTSTPVQEVQEEEEVSVVTPPVFFDCDHKREKKEARCTEKALQDYVQTGLDFEGIEDSTYTATVRIGIRTNGSVGIVQVLTSTDETFSRALIKTIKQLNADGLIWTPAMQDSIAVPFDYFTEFEFTF